jgi:hypothetical protein
LQTFDFFAEPNVQKPDEDLAQRETKPGGIFQKNRSKKRRIKREVFAV